VRQSAQGLSSTTAMRAEPIVKMLPPDSVPASHKSRLEESSVSESASVVYLGVDMPPHLFMTKLWPLKAGA